ncbi:MAG: peptidoglycan-binding protein [Parasporobacterium sp.]|nr:peptidoglycan-binding protein [Parasporobacterium sp.]
MKRKLAFVLITASLIAAMCSTTFAAGRVLTNGSSGDDVYALQQMLAAYGYFYDDPTGYFGDLTENALIQFQYDFGLDADGVAGPLTSSYLGLAANEDYGDDGYDDYDGSDGGVDYADASLSGVFYSGMSGTEVYLLQELLSAYGYFGEAPTGFYGDLTAAAVREFQADYGLEADGIAGPATIGVLTGTSSGASSGTSGSPSGSYDYSGYADAVLDAVYRTPATSAGYCAAWVTQVLRNAGVLTYDLSSLRGSAYSYASTSGLADAAYAGNTGFNANDYWAYVCYSSDVNDLQPGMVVATRSSFTYLGRQFGHVGIYLGDGQVISSVGYLETLSLDEWNSRYNNTGAGSSISWGYLPY